MHHFKALALVAALLTGGALAADSTSTDHNNATMTLTASGTASDAVKFTIAQTTLTIPAAQVRPGASFTVSVPVSNPTSRNIKVSGAAGTPSGGAFSSKLTIAPVNASNVAIAGGSSGTLSYTFTFAAAQAGDPVYTGNVSVTFTITATADDAAPGDLTFGTGGN
ncbi:hypothetical protein E5F05_13750 [Deinococcus metallilatus]|uniref:Uncharacterized protein n=1 Tax=Deinococcus metallilatus TaxID=1211322 RepID=A0AAJ5F4S7_9DEIO|nr:hypothetical protein [Deinococcus metallilatus]MBB5294131.1 hypothetical protein [Deinococcus metallilatus]QBY08914.1 hypothetical protein E5F05_13750 [Deinococcus metallilatus]RXJ10058.1 hypothetical protein ERJ73_12580 [Deinococcus metallilatus]TLK28005.1 hypothetical protein FCS05_08800 [Deinococcus metallilatus]GMA16533.1 hypothetical protein GCM10025871_28640 [Deinococcus metallilatus]